jgi:hypothetical protein
MHRIVASLIESATLLQALQVPEDCPVRLDSAMRSVGSGTRLGHATRLRQRKAKKQTALPPDQNSIVSLCKMQGRTGDRRASA